MCDHIDHVCAVIVISPEDSVPITFEYDSAALDSIVLTDICADVKQKRHNESEIHGGKEAHKQKRKQTFNSF